MSLQRDLPGMNYAAITGIIKRRRGLNLTRSGIPVLHLLVENTVTHPGSLDTTVAEIEVDVWGNLATALESKLHEGDAVFIEGKLAHKKSEDSAGGEHFKTLLRARRIEIMTKKERKI